MKNGPIISGIIGAACFAVPYAALGLSIPFSLLTGVLGFGAGALVFSDNKLKDISIDIENEDVNEILAKAKKMNSDIIGMVNRVEDSGLQTDIRAIYQTTSKIIDTVSKSPKKIKNVQNFFSFYLPETLKLLRKYDEIENQRLGKTGDEFMVKTRKMISKIKDSFNEQLAHLYQEDIIDTDADMKVFDSMMKSEGLDGNDFKL